ncbi:MAG: serine/threonine protein kinase [Lentisphaerales bacterium]|nr:serine/threonine protein kinase [Lentisphaerales bacterium]
MILNRSCLQCNETITATLNEMKHMGLCPHCNADPGQMDCTLAEGDSIGSNYILQEKISIDDFGSYFLGNSDDGTPVHIKSLAPQMHRDEEAKGRFLREIELLSEIRHPAIVAVLESGQDEGVYYLVTEYNDGVDLKEYLKDQGKIPEKDAANLIVPIVEALQAVWDDKKIVHRDIKPEKIFLTDDNHVKIIDIGLAKSLDNEDSMDLTGAGFTVGTPNYLSPEQASAEELDFKTDMYSLGLVFYELLTGQQAFSGPVMEVLNRQLNEMPTPVNEVNPAISERCAKTIEKMIAKSKEDRFESWAHCLEAINLLMDITVLQTDLTFDLSDLEEGDDFEPSMENLNTEDDGVFSSAPKVNASGIILEEVEADNEKDASEESGGIDKIEAGSIIGNGYEIDRKIADGSMGEIYLAFCEEKDKLVQVKILPSHMTVDQEKVERFLQEIKISASLSHPNLLSVIEAGEDNGRYYLVTEYEEGISFHDHIGRYAPIHEKDVLNILIQIAEVLNYAWKEKKLLHREIKPENILIKEGSKDAKLTDFGVAKVMEDDGMNLTGMGFTIGTPEYMSPEQVRGDDDLDPRSDMYAMGLVLYEAVSKKKPFQSDNIMSLMNMQMNDPHANIQTLNSKVSNECSELIDKLLEKDRDNRFLNWNDLIKSMRRVQEGKSILTVDVKPRTKPLTKIEMADKKQKMESTIQQMDPVSSNGNSEKKSPLLLIGGIVIVVVIVILVMVLGGK